MNARRKPLAAAAQRGFTLMEMLVVVAIITLLVSLAMPALNAARESGRRAACQSNLRQIGVGLQGHASRHGAFCSGAFDWRRDGCVTEAGWVADLVAAGIPVGEMLCPSSPYRVSEVYIDLLTFDPAAGSPDPCITLDDMKGSPAKTQPDGSLLHNPCRYILDNPDGLDMSPGSSTRLAWVEQRIFQEHFNTNYTATWVLVRSEPNLTRNGNPLSCAGAPPGPLDSLGATAGPLTLKLADGSRRPSSFIPLMGCGGPGPALPLDIGGEIGGTFTVRSFTRGPVLTMDAPNGFGAAMSPPGPFAEAGSVPDDPSTPEDESLGTPREGAFGVGWWATWNATLQDYRRLGPVHRHSCNLLFADGSVREFEDGNKDDFLNNGFSPAAAPGSGFADDVIELPEEGVFSGWTLKPR